MKKVSEILLKWSTEQTGISRYVVRKKSLSSKDSLIQFFKFGLVGFSNTAVGFGIYYILFFCGVNYLLANVVSWLVSVFNAFYWNNKYVFQSGSGWWRTLFRTYISYGASLLVSTLLMYALVECMQVSPVIAPVLCLLVTVPLNFLLNKFWAFR